jgi:flagellar biosynthesis protein FliP
MVSPNCVTVPSSYCCHVFQINRQASNIIVGVESFITKQVMKPTLDDIREKREEEIKRRIEKEEEARKKREQKVKEKVEEKKRYFSIIAFV